jgi:DivIVA domain-containing protein
MADDRTLTISSSSRLQPGEVARRTFRTTRRGFDPSEVRAYLEQLGREMTAAEEREQALRELLAETEHKVQNPVLDEATLTTALGQETARVLRSAHDAAAELLRRVEGEAERMITEAQEEAGKLQARAEQHATDRAAQSEASATETLRRAQEEAAIRLDAAHVEADALVEQARAECRAMLSEAHELRTRVLGDLARRRRVLHSQIEQLRAGRERLAETISGVRHVVDRVTDDLFRAEDEARTAAEAAGRQLALQAETAALAPTVSTEPSGEAAPAADLQRAEQLMGEPAAPDRSPPEVLSREEAGATAVREASEVSTRSQTVEELFARLRAERSSEGAAPTTGLEGAVVEHPEEPSGSAPGTVKAIVSGRTATLATRRSGEPVLAGDEVPGGEPADVGESEHADETEQAEEPERDPQLARRDEMLGPIVAMLARRLKRALADDQNDILDRLRAGKGWSPDVLRPEAEHIALYARAGLGQLLDAARSGTIFAGGKPGEVMSIEDLTSDLAAAIVIPLRRRLEGEGSGAESGDDAALVEHVGAAFRDWKGARVERLVGDEAVAAFSRAALAATPSGVSLRWVVDDDGMECPDCDDNALAGPMPRGEAFPTGHPHPPAHTGCRCLLVPVDA